MKIREIINKASCGRHILCRFAVAQHEASVVRSLWVRCGEQHIKIYYLENTGVNCSRFSPEQDCIFSLFELFLSIICHF